MMFTRPDPRNVDELNYAIDNAPTRYDVRELLTAWTQRVRARAILGTMIVQFLLVLLVFCLSGCMAIKSKPEIAYQVLNLIDAKQTLQVARHPERWRESTSAWALGEHPSERSVYAYMASCGLAHAAVTQLLLYHGHDSLAGVWQAVTIGEKAFAVAGNHSVGIRVKF